MKQLIKFLIVVILLIGNFTMQAKKQENSGKDEITLIVTSDGATKDEAIKNALRSAIEQTFGVFVSANTDILNDEVVKDEIATVSSGNIKKYEVLSSLVLPSGNISVTLEATVSLSKLISYSKSKGAECEFDGANFAQNVMLKELYEKNEQKALENLTTLIENTLPDLYDYSIEVAPIEEERDIDDDNITAYKFRGIVKLSANNNLIPFWNKIKKTLESISINNYKDLTDEYSFWRNLIVMQYREDGSPIHIDQNYYVWPIATVKENLGLPIGDVYDDPCDRRKIDNINTALCLTRRPRYGWSKNLITKMNELGNKIKIVNQDSERLYVRMYIDNMFSTPFSHRDQHLRESATYIPILPKKLYYIFDFQLDKSQLSKYKSFKVEISK